MKNKAFIVAMSCMLSACCFAPMLAMTRGVSALRYASAEENTRIEQIEYYGRNALVNMENATALLYAYDQIVAGVDASEDSISVNDGVNTLSQVEFQTVLDVYRRDHAEHFWLGNASTITTMGDNVVSYQPTYLMSGTELETAKIEFENAITLALTLIDESMSEFEKELVLHDHLAKSVMYIEANNAHNAYGALVEGKAVCEGYAEAFQCLLQEAGMQSFLVIGDSVSPSSGETEGHEWNIVRVDGAYYHVDLTWNDQDNATYHAYFNVTDETIKFDHKIDETTYAMPSCTTQTANYFEVKGGKLTEYTAASIGALLKDAYSVHVYVVVNIEDFVAWYNTNIVAIATEAGVSGSFSYGYSQLGKEVVLILNRCQHTALTAVAAKAVTCTADGNTAYYVCECGKWFVDAEAKNEIVNKQSVVIVASGHAWNADSCTEDKICGNCLTTEKAKGHTFGGVWHANENEHWNYCTKCNTESQHTAHEFSDWVITKEPTATEEGTQEKSCPCGVKLVQKLNPIGAADSEVSNADTNTQTQASVGCFGVAYGVPMYLMTVLVGAFLQYRRRKE